LRARGSDAQLDLLAYDESAHDVDGNERKPELMYGRDLERVLGALFAEELGAVIQIRLSDRRRVFERLGGVPAQVVAASTRATSCAWCVTPNRY